MYKIAISGKANSGKDIAAKVFFNNLDEVKLVSFADPIKEIVRTMFPKTKRNILYGSSKYREEFIPEVFVNGKQITYRELIQNIGMDGRKYNENIWVDIVNYKEGRALKREMHFFIVKDVRFKNEFYYLKQSGYKTIRIIRDSKKINHISETEQDEISNKEFDHIIYNNGTLEQFENSIFNIIIKKYKKSYDNFILNSQKDNKYYGY